MEVIPRWWQFFLVCEGILHVCGGDPHYLHQDHHHQQYSPRMWRWSRLNSRIAFNCLVFSTYVEVILAERIKLLPLLSILHVCGGDPLNKQIKELQGGYSPRMWRWSWWKVRIYVCLAVFSTYVEVILTFGILLMIYYCILHVCGGDPQLINCQSLKKLYSPRMWRWSFKGVSIIGFMCVFSTYVEVILYQVRRYKSPCRILHVCGGDPSSHVLP